jgi:ABC-type sulfate/molybdate transport systems ATPase subunit
MKSIHLDGVAVQRSSGFRLGPVSITLPARSRTALVGPSGCGKTTLLRCIAGLQRHLSGSIAFDDEIVSGGGAFVDPSQRRIGFVFQDGGLWPHMTASAHLRFANPRLDQSAAVDLLAQFGLGGLFDRRPEQLSGGEAQRLALARAMATDPQILLLDEPLNAVDAVLRTQLADLICRVADLRGLTVVLVTHDEREALAIGHRLLCMEHGQIIEDSTIPATTTRQDCGGATA